MRRCWKSIAWGIIWEGQYSEQIAIDKNRWYEYSEQTTIDKDRWYEYSEQTAIDKDRWYEYSEQTTIDEDRWYEYSEQTTIDKDRWYEYSEQTAIDKDNTVNKQRLMRTGDMTANCETIEQLGSRCSSAICLFVAYTKAKYTGSIHFLRTFDQEMVT